MTMMQSFKRLCKTTVAAAAVAVAGWGVASLTHDLVAPVTASAQILVPPPPPAWTAIGASGSVDESSIPIFGFTNASAGYGANASVAPVEYRYNVVNTHHNVSAAGAIPSVAMPGWTTLEFGAQAPGTSTATAYLYRVRRCSGAQQLVCQVYHTGTPAPGDCKKCQFANTTFNFSSDLYYVRVVLDRNTVNEQPMAHTLRIY